MENKAIFSQQEQPSDESAQILRPWVTPRLQYLNKGSEMTENNNFFAGEWTNQSGAKEGTLAS